MGYLYSQYFRMTGEMYEMCITSYPPSLTVTVTSMGWLTTPTTDLTNEMKRSGNHMMQIKKKMMSPPMPYFTIFFFLCPLGCGYFWGKTYLFQNIKCINFFLTWAKVFCVLFTRNANYNLEKWNNHSMNMYYKCCNYYLNVAWWAERACGWYELYR